MTTRIKIVETYKATPTDAIDNIDAIVCRGRLVCGDVGSFGKMMDIEELRGKLRPVIVSDTEEVEVGSKALSNVNNAIYDIKEIRDGISITQYGTGDAYMSKILAMPENFTDAHIKAIADGELKNNDEVMVECEDRSDNAAIGHGNSLKEAMDNGRPFKIKFDKANHVSLFAVYKEDGWDQVFENLDVFIPEELKEKYLAIRDELKENYNPPTKKTNK